jgi:hypothetical protein
MLYKLIALFGSVFIISALPIDLEELLDMKFPMRKEAKCSLCASMAIFMLLVYYIAKYYTGFVGGVHAQQHQLTAGRLLWAYLLFLYTCLAMCFIPSFVYYWRAAAVIGLLLILHRAWYVCLASIIGVLCVSYPLPLTVNFIAAAVLSVLTKLPVLCTILPLLTYVITANLFLLIYGVTHAFVGRLAILNGHEFRWVDFSLLSMVKKLIFIVFVLVHLCLIYIGEWTLTIVLDNTERIRLRRHVNYAKALLNEKTLALFDELEY